MRFAISIPHLFTDGVFDPAAFRHYLARAEELDFESIWTGEQILGTKPMLGATEVLSFAAARTERIRLGCAVFVSTVHSPLHLAKDIASLDQLSRGRLEIGVSTGGSRRPFAAYGVDPATFVSRFTEGLALMRAIWTEPRLDFDGRFWQVKNGAMEPKPVQQPHPPIWFGAAARPSIRRAVRLGDGFFGAGSSSTAAFTEHVRLVRAELESQQRDPATFRIAKRVYLYVDDDGDRAREQAVAGMERIYAYFGMPTASMAACPVAGTPDEVVDGLREVADAGAELLLLDPLADEAAQLERLATEIIPRLG